MKKTVLLLFLLAIVTNVTSQNMVPNYSFEEYYDCPFWQGEFYVDYWFKTPNSYPSTPEYYNDCSPEDTQSDVPENIAGFQYPYEGEGYAGIFCYGDDSVQREYIEIQLTSPLIEGQEYEFSMQVSLPENFGLGINNLGALFTDEILEGNGPGEPLLIEANPQVKAIDPIIDKENWTQITGTFIAEGGEEYLTIGNFFSDEDTIAVDVPEGYMDLWSYYYIDAVSLIAVILGTNDNALENQLSIYPNPTNYQINIELVNNHSSVTIKLYTILGELIYKKSITNQLLKIDMSDLSRGIYLLELTDSQSNHVVKRISKL